MWHTGGGRDGGEWDKVMVRGRQENIVHNSASAQTEPQLIFSENSLYIYSAEAALLAGVEEMQGEWEMGKDGEIQTQSNKKNVTLQLTTLFTQLMNFQ